jgi:GH24 family phage-related lysozyme (muramidase)
MTSKRAVAALAGATSGVALAIGVLIHPWEQTRLVSYRDMVGVWTVCDGETKNIGPNMRFTPEQCKAMLDKRTEDDYHKPLTQCIPGFDKKPLSWQAAAISLAYNVGVGAVCKSTGAALARAGRMADSCLAFTRFDRAGGKVVQGLVNRRTDGDATRIGEYELCVAGL